jgi:uncharacterized protein
MALIVDAGAMYALADADEPRHAAVAAIFRAERSELVTSELAVAEADYLILDRLGIDVELAFIDDLIAGAIRVECLSRSELEAARGVVKQYRDLEIGLADASLVVLAARYATTRICSFDERAFRSVRTLNGEPFVMLPADTPG